MPSRDRLVGPACCWVLALILSSSVGLARSTDPASAVHAPSPQPFGLPPDLAYWVPLHRLAPGSALVSFTVAAPRIATIFLTIPTAPWANRTSTAFGPPRPDLVLSAEAPAPQDLATAQGAAPESPPAPSPAAGQGDAVQVLAPASPAENPVPESGTAPGTAASDPGPVPVADLGGEATVAGVVEAPSGGEAAPSAEVPAVGGTPDTGTASPTAPDPLLTLQAELLEQVNQRRSSAGLAALALDPRLVASATEHSQDMARRRFCRHRGSDGSSARARIARHGYPFKNWAGENIICSRRSVESAMQWWMNSGPHRRNILHRHFTHIGIGIDPNGPYGGYMFTLNFGAGATESAVAVAVEPGDPGGGEAGDPGEGEGDG